MIIARYVRVFGFAKRLGSTALLLAVAISGGNASEVDSKSKFVYSESCRARDWTPVPVKTMQRELPGFNWDCDLGKTSRRYFPIL